MFYLIFKPPIVLSFNIEELIPICSALIFEIINNVIFYANVLKLSFCKQFRAYEFSNSIIYSSISYSELLEHYQALLHTSIKAKMYISIRNDIFAYCISCFMIIVFYLCNVKMKCENCVNLSY